MKEIELVEVYEDDELYKQMVMLDEFFIVNGINNRIACALSARFLYEAYRKNCSKEVYFRYLDQCKKLWED